MDLVKNMKILFDLSPVKNNKILQALDQAAGNIDEALIIFSSKKIFSKKKIEKNLIRN